MTASARLLIVGPQGSGKGTQGVRIAEGFGIPVVSTGDIFRANIKGGTELGQKVSEITARGDLVPDELTSEIVRDRLRGFQSGAFSCRENACALTHIEEALMWLNRRVEDRIERRVLGTEQK